MPAWRRVDVRLRQQAPAQQARDLVRIDLVVLGFPPVDGLHRQRVAEHERDPVRGADIGEPVPREHALGRDDQVVSVRRDHLEERLRGRWQIPVQQHLPGRIQDADIHGLDVEIDPAVVTMLAVVESHLALLLRESRIDPCVSLLVVSRCRGRAE